MKTLYFVGNEELWNNAWFQALVESLKSRTIRVELLDNIAEAADVKNHLEKLSLYERMVFNKDLDPVAFAKNLSFKISEDKIPLLFIFSEIVNPNSNPKNIAWGISAEDFLKEVGMLEASQVIEEAFILDDNLAGEVSRAIQISGDSLVDTHLLTADVAELEKLIDVDSKTNIQEVSPPAHTEIAEIPIAGEKSIAAELDVVSVAVESKDEVDLAAGLFDEPVALEESPREEVPEAPEVDIANKTVLIKPVETKASDDVIVPVSVIPDNTYKSSRDFSEEPKKGAAAPSIEVSQLLSSMSQSVSGEDMEVLRRYASLKERELRESQAATEALRRQIRYFDERLKKSEEERRKLLLKLEESSNELRTLSDKKEENKVQLRGIEGRYEEKIKELLAQLESSQFQASKLEKKFLDFKERVRNDLQKIRSRERELASRLEIQKRDAEALLSAKDERLLNQKREMDRLEFDMDALKERLLDDAQKNEEKRKRVARALQSLKLAQSILAGLDEDVVTKDEKDKAA